MKAFLFTIIFLPLFALAQTGRLGTHKVLAKESYSSIGRLYNINGRALAEYNALDYDKGLSIGQVIKIPVGAQAKLPPAAPAKPIVAAPATVVSDVSGTPVYHTVLKKETLYSISKQYAGIDVDDIKKWNRLADNAVSEGSTLIVGYTNPNERSPKVNSPSPKAKEVLVKATPPVSVPEQKAAAPAAPVATPVRVYSGNTGFFTNQYTAADGSEVKGVAGVFKSTSGWDDGKYYCLHNAAKAGSIIKITNVGNNKVVYAKVLDVMPDLQQNNNVLVRLSNAAADALGAGSVNFDCIINY